MPLTQIKRSERKPRPGKRPSRRRRTQVAVVGSLEAARAALAGAPARIVLVSPPGAPHTLGIGYFAALVDAARAEFRQNPIEAVMDCGDEPGRALAALRAGFKIIVLRGHPTAHAAVTAIAREMGARVLRHPPRGR